MRFEPKRGQPIRDWPASTGRIEYRVQAIVVGSPRHRDPLGGACDSDSVALLVPDPANADSSAVRVILTSGQAGHLPREEAIAYRGAIDLAARHGMLVGCHAEFAVTRDHGPQGTGSVGVVLRMGDPDRVYGQVALELSEAAPTVVAGWPQAPRRSSELRW